MRVKRLMTENPTPTARRGRRCVIGNRLYRRKIAKRWGDPYFYVAGKPVWDTPGNQIKWLGRLKRCVLRQEMVKVYNFVGDDYESEDE